MTDKQINKWLRRRFTVVGWALLGYYLLMNLLVTLGMAVDSLQQLLPDLVAGRPPEMDMEAMMNNAWPYMLSAVLGLAILHACKGPEHWRQEIWAREQKMTGKVFFCLISFCIGAQMINTLWITGLELVMNCFDRSVMEMLEQVAGSTDTLSMFLYASIVAPLTEELIFRGYTLRALRPYGKRFAIAASALLFGLFHGNLLQTPYAILVGLVLGYVTVEYSILWAIAIHVFNNLVLADLLTRLTMNWSELAIGTLNLALFGGFLLVSIGILIRNRQEIHFYQVSEWMDRRVVKCFFTNSGILLLTVVMVLNMVMMLFV